MHIPNGIILGLLKNLYFVEVVGMIMFNVDDCLAEAKETEADTHICSGLGVDNGVKRISEL